MSSTTLTLRVGDSAATVSSKGAALVGLTLGDREVIPAFDFNQNVYGGVLLAPWPNRIRAASYDFQGKQYHPEALDGLGNALHGLVHNVEAVIIEQSDSHLVLQHTIQPSDAYPGELRVESSFLLESNQLTITYTATNCGSGKAPVGLGAHPYFPFDESTKITLNANTASVHGSDMLPTGQIAALDLGLGGGHSRNVAELSLDTQFTNLESPVVILSDAKGEIEIWQQNANWLMVYTTQSFPWLAGSGPAIAIEPQTMAADGFNNGQGLQVLAPGVSTAFSWGIRIPQLGY
jgi:aldose 1-epimerase